MMAEIKLHTNGGAYIGNDVHCTHFIGRDQINIIMQVDRSSCDCCNRFSEELQAAIHVALAKIRREGRNELMIEDVLEVLEYMQPIRKTRTNQISSQACPNGTGDKWNDGTQVSKIQPTLEPALAESFQRLLTNSPMSRRITSTDLVDDIWEHADAILLQRLHTAKFVKGVKQLISPSSTILH